MAKQKRKTIEELIKERQIESDIKQKYNIEENQKIVIEKKSIISQILFFIQNSIIKLLKALFYIAIAILSSIGFTVLINESLRTMLFDIIKKSFL